MWFKQLMGFEEGSPENVRAFLSIEGSKMISKANGQSYEFGVLEIPTLHELKAQALDFSLFSGRISVTEVVADVQELHGDVENTHALFQAASQFNLLEMVSPQVSPEQGVDRYEKDHTQGPACAIACGAGTIYRNYFVPLHGQIGQTEHQQVDCLELMATALNNTELDLWEMRNGYALLNQKGLLHINAYLGRLNEVQREHFKGLLKIGIQWHTEVTRSAQKHLVSQAYCSALPVAYTSVESAHSELFARVILEATYEATLYAALINLSQTGVNKVYLTLVGGGVFGNELHWILESLLVAIRKFQNTPLDIRIVSYGQSNHKVRQFLKEV